MLMDLIDGLVGRVSRKWLVGRRFVLDLSDAVERRVAVVELPSGNFSFDLEAHEGTTRLVLQQDGASRVLGTFSELVAAQRCARRVRWAMVRPLRRIVLACVGFFFVILTFDVLTMPRAVSVPGPRAAMAPSLSSEQLAALRQASQASQSASIGAGPVAATPPGESPSDGSTPEARAAIKLLKGR